MNMNISVTSPFWEAGCFAHAQMPNVHERTFNKHEPVEKVIKWIHSTYLNHEGAIDTLSFCCHGWPGIVSIGTGFGKVKAHLFSSLHGAFAPDGRGILIHACYVACATKDPLPEEKGVADASGWGYEMMAALAAATDTSVTAAIDYVAGIRGGFAFDDQRTMTVMPNGDAVFTNCQ
ncbi:MAG: hypothetical protein ABI999_19440 [Acidobacteriota bacterium]